MFKVGMVGIGNMGRGHVDQYMRLKKEGFGVELAAVCDIDPKKFGGEFIPGNIDPGRAEMYNFAQYHLYTDLDEMLKKETLDYVDIALPTYLHAEAAIKAMRAGVNVLCEKPMALCPEQCEEMIKVQRETGRTLMIAQCLRFWPVYEALKEAAASGRYGALVSAYFFRGGSTPRWSYQDWLLKKEKSGGVLLDQHVHDVDMINYVFGMPDSVSTQYKQVLPESGYDAVSTHYKVGGAVICAQDDWVMSEAFGFEMSFRVNFERATLVMRDDKVTVYPHDGEKFQPDTGSGNGYYREIKAFVDALERGEKIIPACTPESTADTIRIATAERKSADLGGEWVKVE